MISNAAMVFLVLGFVSFGIGVGLEVKNDFQGAKRTLDRSKVLLLASIAISLLK